LGQLFGQRGTALLPVTHQELAHELGTTREVVSRMLKEFERLGCIRLHRGSIELISPRDLARLSEDAAV
jgi:CRP/FNR family transcriptional regulator